MSPSRPPCAYSATQPYNRSPSNLCMISMHDALPCVTTLSLCCLPAYYSVVVSQHMHTPHLYLSSAMDCTLPNQTARMIAAKKLKSTDTVKSSSYRPVAFGRTTASSLLVFCPSHVYPIPYTPYSMLALPPINLVSQKKW